MLGKLLKYELPAMGRRLLPLYAAWAATAIFLGVATQMSSSKSDFASVISILLYTAIATAIMVMTVVMIIQRYSNSLLGDEAYGKPSQLMGRAALHSWRLRCVQPVTGDALELEADLPEDMAGLIG